MTRKLLVGLTLGVSLVARPAAAGPTKQECVANNESAQDLRQAGHLREARARLALCTAASCPAVVRQDCAQRLAEIDAILPSVVFVAKDTGGNDLSAVHVTMDGKPVRDKLDGKGVAVDPGEHLVTFSAEGFRPTTRTVVVREGEVDRRIEMVLRSYAEPVTSPDEGRTAAHAATPAPVAEPTAVAPAPALARVPKPAPQTGADSGSSAWAPIGLVVGSVGLAGLFVGGVLAVLAKTTEDRATSECPTHRGCSTVALDDSSLAMDDANFSTAAVIGGGALLAAGAAMFLLAPRKDNVKVGAMAGPGGGRISLTASW